MSYCTNCGKHLDESSKFCHNCGQKNENVLKDLNMDTKISKQSTISDTKVEFDDRERFEIDRERIQKHFRHLIIDQSIYFEKDIPVEKLKEFSRNFNDIIIDNSVFYIYYDDSIDGIGSEGFGIVMLENEVFFLFSTAEDGQFGTYFKDIKKTEYLDEFGLIFTVMDEDDEKESGFVYKPKNIVISMALLSFIKGEYNWFVGSSDQAELILSMMNFNSDDEDDEDDDPANIRQ